MAMLNNQMVVPVWPSEAWNLWHAAAAPVFGGTKAAILAMALMNSWHFIRPFGSIMDQYPWRIHGAAIYGAPWIPSIYPLYVSIYTSTMDPSWDMDHSTQSARYCSNCSGGAWPAHALRQALGLRIHDEEWMEALRHTESILEPRTFTCEVFVIEKTEHDLLSWNSLQAEQQ